MDGVTVPMAIIMRLAAVRFFVTGSRVAASVKTVMACDNCPSARKGTVMGTRVYP